MNEKTKNELLFSIILKAYKTVNENKVKKKIQIPFDKWDQQQQQKRVDQKWDE